MTRVQQTYLELLKSAIWNHDVQIIVHSEDLQSIIQLSAFQGTGPLVFDQLLKLKDVEIPAALRMQMKQQCLMSMKQQNAMMPILNQAWTALEEADIHPVLLKGLALAQYYPQPHLRQWGDVDLYVGQEDYHKSCGILRGTFPEAEHPDQEYEDNKHYNFIFPNALLEMHRISMAFAHPQDRKYYEGLEVQYLTKDGPIFEIDGLKITTPEETFNVFFTFLHAWHHFLESGMNMKQVCDIAVLLHAKRETIDRERLKEMLMKLHLMEIWQLLMYIIAHYLGLAQEECPFYTEACKERAESFFNRVMEEGQSRQIKIIASSKMTTFRRKWNTLLLRMDDYRLVKSYAPRYARHMVWSAILHGIERAFK